VLSWTSSGFLAQNSVTLLKQPTWRRWKATVGGLSRPGERKRSFSASGACRDSKVDSAKTTLDHLAFLIDVTDYDDQRRRLEGFGVDVVPKEFPEFDWRSLFFTRR